MPLGQKRVEETRIKRLEESIKRYNDNLIVKINETNGDDILRNAIIALENTDNAPKLLKQIRKDKIVDILAFLNNLQPEEAKEKYKKTPVDDCRELIITSYEFYLPKQCRECLEIYNDDEIADYRNCFICNMRMCPSCIPVESWGNNATHVKGLLPVCLNCETNYAYERISKDTADKSDNSQSKTNITDKNNRNSDATDTDKITVIAEIHNNETEESNTETENNDNIPKDKKPENNDTIPKDKKPEVTDPEDKKQRVKSKVCGFHEKGFCKHGVKGDSCNFLHPKLCYSHINSGKCKRGAECEYHHPKICRDGINCSRKKCRFVHTKEMKEAMTLNKLMKKNKSDVQTEASTNTRTDRKYSDVVINDKTDEHKKSKKNESKKEDFQDPKPLKDTSQPLEELKDYLKSIAEKVETLMTERNYYQQWNWIPQTQYQNLNYQQ